MGDQKKIQDTGMVKIGMDFAECMQGDCRPGDHACVSKCMTEKETFSAPCGECFGNMAFCPQEQCSQPCQQGPNNSKIECIMCLSMKCVAPFQQCTQPQQKL